RASSTWHSRPTSDGECTSTRWPPMRERRARRAPPVCRSRIPRWQRYRRTSCSRHSRSCLTIRIARDRAEEIGTLRRRERLEADRGESEDRAGSVLAAPTGGATVHIEALELRGGSDHQRLEYPERTIGERRLATIVLQASATTIVREAL